MPRITKFGIAGGNATAVHVSVPWSVFNWLLRDATVASVAAFAIANFVSFQLQTLWSFFSRTSVMRLLRFATRSISGLLAAGLIPFVCGRGTLRLPTLGVVICIGALSFVLRARRTYRAA